MIRGRNKIVTKVASEYLERCGGVVPVMAELLEQMEIAAGIEDVESGEVGPSPCLRPLAQTAHAVFPQAAFLCGSRRLANREIRFAHDSPLEGDGFEPSVPREKDGEKAKEMPIKKGSKISRQS
jgi:hypothetical protein